MSADLELLRQNTPERLWRFAEHFLESLDAPASAAAVGAPGKAKELLLDRRTQAALRALQGQVAEAHADTRAGALRMLLQLATFDPGDAFRGGLPLPFDELPPELRVAATVSVNKHGEASYTFDAKVRLAAIDRILQMTGDLLPQGTGSTGAVKVVFRGRDE